MNSNKLIAVAAVTATLVAGAFTPSASADTIHNATSGDSAPPAPLVAPAASDSVTTKAEASAVASQLADVSPQGEGTPIAVKATTGASVTAMLADLGGTTVSVPNDPAAGTVLDAGGAAITLKDPSAATADNAVAGGPGVVVSNANNGTMNATVLTAGGIQQARIITSLEAPTRFPTSIDLPPGGRIEPSPDGGYTVVDAAGQPITSVAPAWAKDANGEAVPTRYELSGNVLTQVVEVGPDTALPVTADPFWSTQLDYLRCVFGVGVPAGVAAYFVATLGWRRAWSAIKGGYTPTRGTAVPSWAAGYARAVGNACYRYLRS